MEAPSVVQRVQRSLKSARVVFTGRLASQTRQEARAIVTAAGGVAVDTVSRRTSMIVVGMDGWPLLPDGTISRKLQRAEALNRRGAAIEILSEMAFLESAGLAEHAPRLAKGYPASRVCELLGLEPAVLQRWELFGLIRSQDGLYDFRDIVSLRTIAELIGHGVDPRTIRGSMRGLASVLPGTDRPLSQLKIVIEQPRSLLAELGELLVAPDGQLLLNFAGRDSERPTGRPVPLSADPASSTADEWFEHGRCLEDQERLTEAADAYRAALALRAEFPEAHFNLGNVLRGLGLQDAAEQQYRVALAQDPAMAVSWYNLADLQEEGGRLAAAQSSLLHAIEACPGYADAHFNLAWCCERLGRTQDARAHWAAYLELDPVSEWADVARQHLASLKPEPLDPISQGEPSEGSPSEDTP